MGGLSGLGRRFDFFLSFEREDATEYAWRLREALEDSGLSVYIAPRPDDPTSLGEATKALAGSRALILIGTESVGRDPRAAMEVRLARDGGRPVLPIDVGGARESIAADLELVDSLWQLESISAVVDRRRPSPDVVQALARWAAFDSRERRRRRRFLTLAGLVLGAGALLVHLETTRRASETARRIVESLAASRPDSSLQQDLLWELVERRSSRFRSSFFAEITRSGGISSQMRPHVQSAVHALVGMDEDARGEVVREGLRPCLRGSAPLDRETLSLCADVAVHLGVRERPVIRAALYRLLEELESADSNSETWGELAEKIRVGASLLAPEDARDLVQVVKRTALETGARSPLLGPLLAAADASEAERFFRFAFEASVRARDESPAQAHTWRNMADVAAARATPEDAADALGRIYESWRAGGCFFSDREIAQRLRPSDAHRLLPVALDELSTADGQSPCRMRTPCLVCLVARLEGRPARSAFSEILSRLEDRESSSSVIMVHGLLDLAGRQDMSGFLQRVRRLELPPRGFDYHLGRLRRALGEEAPREASEGPTETRSDSSEGVERKSLGLLADSVFGAELDDLCNRSDSHFELNQRLLRVVPEMIPGATSLRPDALGVAFHRLVCCVEGFVPPRGDFNPWPPAAYGRGLEVWVGELPESELRPAFQHLALAYSLSEDPTTRGELRPSWIAIGQRLGFQALLDVLKRPDAVGSLREKVLQSLTELAPELGGMDYWNTVQWSRESGFDIETLPRRSTSHAPLDSGF